MQKTIDKLNLERSLILIGGPMDGYCVCLEESAQTLTISSDPPIENITYRRMTIGSQISASPARLQVMVSRDLSYEDVLVRIWKRLLAFPEEEPLSDKNALCAEISHVRLTNEKNEILDSAWVSRRNVESHLERWGRRYPDATINPPEFGKTVFYNNGIHVPKKPLSWVDKVKALWKGPQ